MRSSDDEQREMDAASGLALDRRAEAKARALIPNAPELPSVERITAEVAENFRSFGGGRDVSGSNNPIAHALQDRPAQFAAGVDVAEVVRFVLDRSSAPVMLITLIDVIANLPPDGAQYKSSGRELTSWGEAVSRVRAAIRLATTGQRP